MPDITTRLMTSSDLYLIYKQHPVITTDSRNCPKGSMFIALKGATFDGNLFAAKALQDGCAIAVVDNPDVVPADDPRYVLVEDALTVYKEIAREHRRRFHIPVIGITGTNGKTTTKELLSAVLARKYKVMHTEGNYNNDVGVPLTLLRLQPDDEIAVVEMGASHPGDIDKLVRYVEPTCGLITNVGRAHLQGFGSFEGVKKTKGELYDYLAAHDGLIFLNEANEHLVEMARMRRPERVVGYGQSDKDEYNVRGRVTACAPCLQFEWSTDAVPGTYRVNTQMVGTYNLDNMLAAITVGLHFGVPAAQISAALEQYTPSNNRSQLMNTATNTLIVDAYNANPSSMTAAIDNFAAITTDRQKMAIIGDMRELGDVSTAEHQRIVDALEQQGIDEVWLVGPEFGHTKTSFRHFDDVEAVKQAIKDNQPQNKCILIKGSNGTKLFQLPELL